MTAPVDARAVRCHADAVQEPFRGSCSSLTPLFWRWPSPMTARKVMPLRPDCAAKPWPRQLLDLEVASVLRRQNRAGLIDERRSIALADLAALPVQRALTRPAQPLLELRETLTMYDAAYIALAEALDCTLLTGDRRLTRAAGRPASSRYYGLHGEPSIAGCVTASRGRGRCCARRNGRQNRGMPPICWFPGRHSAAMPSTEPVMQPIFSTPKRGSVFDTRPEGAKPHTFLLPVTVADDLEKSGSFGEVYSHVSDSESVHSRRGYQRSLRNSSVERKLGSRGLRHRPSVLYRSTGSRAESQTTAVEGFFRLHKIVVPAGTVAAIPDHALQQSGTIFSQSFFEFVVETTAPS